MQFRLTAVVASMAATACASTPAPKDDIQASIRKCGLEGQLQVEIEGKRQLHVRHLDPNIAYLKFDCFITEVRRLRLDLQIVATRLCRSDELVSAFHPKQTLAGSGLMPAAMVAR